MLINFNMSFLGVLIKVNFYVRLIVVLIAMRVAADMLQSKNKQSTEDEPDEVVITALFVRAR